MRDLSAVELEAIHGGGFFSDLFEAIGDFVMEWIWDGVVNFLDSLFD